MRVVLNGRSNVVVVVAKIKVYQVTNKPYLGRLLNRLPKGNPDVGVMESSRFCSPSEEKVVEKWVYEI